MISFDFKVSLGDNIFNFNGEINNGITALIGKSGAGKSTFANALAGLITPEEGKIYAQGQVFFDSVQSINLPSCHRGIGFVFQTHRLFPHLTVLQNILFGRRFGGRKNKLDAEDVLIYLGLEDKADRKTGTLSGGEAQRVALGRALISATSFLIMDEPLSSLDPKLRQDLLTYIKGLPSLIPVPILYISHSRDEVIQLAEETIVISQNRIAVQGPTAQILSARAEAGIFPSFHSQE